MRVQRDRLHLGMKTKGGVREESERGSFGQSSSSDDDDNGAGPSGGAATSFIDVRAIESTSGAAPEVRIF